MLLPSLQFLKDVRRLIAAFDEFANHFGDINADMYSLESKEIVCPQAVKNLYSIKDIGRKRFHDYFNDGVWKRSVAITATISQNNFNKKIIASIFAIILTNVSVKNLYHHQCETVGLRLE